MRTGSRRSKRMTHPEAIALALTVAATSFMAWDVYKDWRRVSRLGAEVKQLKRENDAREKCVSDRGRRFVQRAIR